ncbi:hypothetical protein Nepgr_024571 [Nepenthes gracilis]|uniref:SPX domain-containing protein n=1 Tax=Nepenthes gracilis TaxID=150966 RepID=A0AAD3T334_NEPGR|nr:hypothetical protein Nepgr_024571 [Nepenthes gracilis]
MQEVLPIPTDEQIDGGKYHFMSLLLNLASTFLYMVNTYIIVPTADDYSQSLGAAATVCGVVIGAMAIAQIFSSVYFSAWSNRSYFRPLIFSSILLFVGNILYALAYDFNSIWVLIIGRLLCGLGSARAVNRRYISDIVPLSIRMQASTGFVSASALGMACGPAVAGLLQTNFKFYKLTFNQVTLPGWGMAAAWLLYILWLWISFREPSHDENQLNPQSTAESSEYDALEKGMRAPLLSSFYDKEGEEGDASDESLDESPATSIGSAFRLLTPPVKVQLLIYFVLKYAMEILLSESSVVTTYYFNWSTSTVAIFLAGLGLIVLPINIFVGRYVGRIFEERQILMASQIMVCIGILLNFHVLIPYSVQQYVCSGLIMFVSAEVLEGLTFSLANKKAKHYFMGSCQRSPNVSLRSFEDGCLWEKLEGKANQRMEKVVLEIYGSGILHDLCAHDFVSFSYYLDYKLLKQSLKRYIQQIETRALDKCQVLQDFSRMLDKQIEKIVLFLVEQQGLVSVRLAKLGEELSSCDQQLDIAKIFELRAAYREVGLDLLQLLHFFEMNAIGLRKILKKFDKHLKCRFTDYYVKSRAKDPYSQLQQVFIKHVGIEAVVGTVCRSLAFLQQTEGRLLSISDQSAIVNQDPVVELIEKTVGRLTHLTNYFHFITQHSLFMQEELPIPTDEQNDDGKYHFMSLLLNLASTFLYMVNTYIIVPTADDYSQSLGAAATVCGVVIGAMAIAQIFSSVYFSAWSNRSYFRPLIFSSVLLFVGNILYALAYDFNSIWVLIIGRLLCGLGSARAVNRRYISDIVPLSIRMQASTGFVSASALGMACGPAVAGLLQTNFKFYKLTFNQVTLPGWGMAAAWLLYILWLWISFQEPSHDEDQPNPQSTAESSEYDALEKGMRAPLLSSFYDKEGEEGDASDESLDESPATSIGSAFRLLTPPVKVQLLIYFVLKYAMEILLSESSVVTTYYFNWSMSTVAIFLAGLGLTVLPINFFVGSYVGRIFEERQILMASQIMVCIGILLNFHVLIPYSVQQYVCSGLIMFVSAEVLEGVNLSLLSRVMPPRLSRGTYNSGLLSTEAGTLARVIADVTITLVGYLGENMLLNLTQLPSLLLSIASIIVTYCTYNSLL